jgi:hypothetical protein
LVTLTSVNLFTFNLVAMMSSPSALVFANSFIYRNAHRLASFALRSGLCCIAKRSVFCVRSGVFKRFASVRHRVDHASVLPGRHTICSDQIRRTLCVKSGSESGKAITSDGHISNRCSCCGLNTKGNRL